jgi:hypothetical protein
MARLPKLVLAAFLAAAAHDRLSAETLGLFPPGSATTMSVIPSGAAVTRTMASKLSDGLSVIDLGADPTGTTDSTAAFNATRNSKRVFDVPPGRYLIAGCLQLDQMGLRGAPTFQRTAPGDVSLSSGSVLLFQPSTKTCPAQIATQQGGLDIEGITFFWPEQNGSQALQTVTVNGAGAAAGTTTIPVSNAASVPQYAYVTGTGLPTMERVLSVNAAAGTIAVESPLTAALAAGATFSFWAPAVYPPLLAPAPGGQLVDLTFERNVVINAYDFIGLPPSTAGAGDWRISENRIYAVHHAFDLTGGMGETTQVNNNMFTYGIYGSVALTAPGYLARWSGLNAEWIHVDVGNNLVDGMVTSGNLVHGFRYGERVISGVLDLFQGIGNLYDGVATILSVEGAAGYVGEQYGGTHTTGVFDPVTGSFQAQLLLPGISFTQSGPVRAKFDDMGVGYSAADAIDITGTGPTAITFFGDIFENYGLGTITDAWGVNCTNPNADLAISSVFKGTGRGNQDGLALSGCGAATVTGNVFDGMKIAVIAYSGGRASIVGNTTSGTTGGASLLQFSANFATLEIANNVWDTPGPTHVGWPVVAAQVDAAQTISSTAKTQVIFGNDALDEVGAFSNSTFNAPQAGYYQIGARVALAAGGTAGDVWTLTLDQAGSATKSSARDYVASAAVGAVDANDVFYLVKGDTVTVSLQRTSGTGSWPIPADGSRTRFTARLVQ